METIDLSKLQGNATAILKTTTNFSALPDGRIRAVVKVEKNTYEMPDNPRTDSNTKDYIYEGAAAQVITDLERDHKSGMYLSNTQGV